MADSFRSSFRGGSENAPMPKFTPSGPTRVKKKKHNIFYNLLSDVYDLRHIPSGIMHMGAAMGHDILKLHGGTTKSGDKKFAKWAGTDGAWASDDILEGIFNQYKYTYGPALHGDFGTSWDRIKEHPLGPILDVATVVSAGGAAAAKVGASAATGAGRMGSIARAVGATENEALRSLGARIAGIQKASYDSYVPRKYRMETNEMIPDPKYTVDAKTAQDIAHENLVKGLQFEGKTGLPSIKQLAGLDEAAQASRISPEFIQAQVVGANKRSRGYTSKIENDAKYPELPAIWEPKKITMKSGSRTMEVNAINNPVRRMVKQHLGYSIGSSPLTSRVPLIGNDRKMNREARRMLAHQQRGLAQPLERLSIKMGNLDPSIQENVALFLGAHSIDDAMKHYQNNLETIGQTIDEATGEVSFGRGKEYIKEQQDLLKDLDNRIMEHGSKAGSEQRLIFKRSIDTINNEQRVRNVSLQAQISNLENEIFQLEDMMLKPEPGGPKRSARRQSEAHLRRQIQTRRKKIARIRKKADIDSARDARAQELLDMSAKVFGHKAPTVAEARVLRDLVLRRIHMEKNAKVYGGALTSRLAQLGNPIIRSTITAMKIRNIEKILDDADISDAERAALSAKADELATELDSIIREASVNSPDIIETIQRVTSDDEIDKLVDTLNDWQDVEELTADTLMQLYGDRNTSRVAELIKEQQDLEAQGLTDSEQYLRNRDELRADNTMLKSRGQMEDVIFNRGARNDPFVSSVDPIEFDMELEDATNRITSRQKELGLRPTGRAVRSHKIREDHPDIRTMSRNKSLRESKQDAIKYITVDMALDATDAKSVQAAMEQAVATQISRQRLSILFSNKQEIPNGAEVPKGWEPLLDRTGSASKIERALNDIVNTLHNEVSIGFDPDASPLLEQIKGEFEDMLSVKDDSMIIVPSALKRDIIREIDKTEKFLQKFLDNPQRFWRAWTLGARPAWIVNQAVGNAFLLYTTHGLFRSLGYILEDIAIGTRAERKQFKEHMVEKAPDAFSAGFYRSEIGRYNPADIYGIDSQDSVSAALAKRSRVARTLFAPERVMEWAAKHVDDPFRRWAFIGHIRPAVKELQERMRAAGKPVPSFKDAATMLMDDDAFLDVAINNTLEDMVNFRDMSEIERRWVRRFIPFYSWISGISRRTVRMLDETPGRALAYYRLSQDGKDWMSKLWGDVQDYILTYIPLGDPRTNDKVNVIKTSQLNPLTTVGDLSGTVQSLLGGKSWKGTENPLSQINPIIKSLLETATGQDIYYGSPLEELSEKRPGSDYGGDPDASRAGVLISRLIKQFPQSRLLEELSDEDNPRGVNLTTNSQAALGYAGYPVITTNALQARRKGLEEERRRLYSDRIKSYTEWLEENYA